MMCHNKKLLIILLFITSAIFSCSDYNSSNEIGAFSSEGILSKGDNNTEPHEAKSSSIRYVNWYDNYHVNQVQYAGRNGGHQLGTFSVESFNIKEAEAQIQAYDADRNCNCRSRSTSTADAILRYQDFVARKKPYDSSEVNSRDAHYYQEQLLNIVEDQHNLAVFSSAHKPDGFDKIESCLYYDFYIFRSNGTVIHLTFDYTD